MAPRVLISDKLSPLAEKVFTGRGIEVDVKVGLEKAELAPAGAQQIVDRRLLPEPLQPRPGVQCDHPGDHHRLDNPRTVRRLSRRRVAVPAHA